MDVKVRSSGCPTRGWARPAELVGRMLRQRPPDAVRTAPSPRTAMLYSAVLIMRLYLITRDLHLYLGMFISPFVLVFSLSVILLIHGWVPAATPEPAVRTVTGLSLPVGLERLAGRDLVNALRPVLDAIGVKGEVDFIRAISRAHSLV